MSSDLIALVVAVTLGAVVVVVGLRRNLADTTLNWLPRSGDDSEREVATPISPDWGRRRRPLTRRQRRWRGGLFLLLGLAYAVMALVWSDNRLFDAFLAALWMILAAGHFRGSSTSDIDSNERG